MTGNISYLTDFKEHDGGYVAFEGGAKGGKITSKGTIRTDKLNFEDVYFVKELQFNLLVSHRSDESQVLLKVPRKNNMYSFDMKNIVPQKDLTCPLAKATNDESMLWHRFTWVFLLATKDETSRILKSFITKIEILVEKKVKIIICDNETEFKNRIMNEFCEKNDQLGKFDGKSNKRIFVGYSIISKAFRVYNTRTRKVEENLHITFLENKPMITGSGPEWLFDIDALSKLINYAPVPAVNNATPTYADYLSDPLIPNLEDTGIFDDAYDDRDEDAEADYNNLETVISVSPIPSTRIHKDHPKEQIFEEMEPKKVTQALDDESWVKAMQEEFLQFKLLNVWTLVDLPHRKRAIGTKWVYRNKRDQRGIIVKNKARLVAQEYIAASNCCGLVLYLQNQLPDYRYDFMQTKIHVDNESVICVVKNPNTSSSKTINSVKQIHDIIDGKAVVIFESSLRSNLLFDDEDGKGDSVERAIPTDASLKATQASDNILKTQTTAMPNVDIPQGMDTGGSPRRQETMGGTFAQTRVSTLENELLRSKSVYHKAFITLTKRVKKLETQLKQKRSRAVIHSSDEEEPSEISEPSKDDDDETLAETLLSIKRTKEAARQEQEKYNLEKALELQRQLDKREKDVDKGDHAKEIDWSYPTVLRYHALQNRPFSKAEVRKNMCMYLKNQGGYKQSYFKGMKYEEIRPISERVWDQVYTFVPKDFEVKKVVIKRSRFHLQQESLKKQKLDQQTEEKVKVQVDSDQEIVKEGRISTYHIIKADGSTKGYTSMINLLENIDREDLEALWKLVKDKHRNTRPEEGYERVLWGDLKVMFEPDIESEMWRQLQGYDVTVWKLFFLSGVHFVIL
uniref:Retrovirus-related Pol polyprotein from transposon TNT 1-94 n=1 Tax=Tanacetum cinerariifolium TaxID=118510 RepID=A0A6L2LJ32_TANCI|nr:retrovirus-related Pol polyprotein from transposon TNT 1-94 [Tanacetum cinerariifolium]